MLAQKSGKLNFDMKNKQKSWTQLFFDQLHPFHMFVKLTPPQTVEPRPLNHAPPNDPLRPTKAISAHEGIFPTSTDGNMATEVRRAILSVFLVAYDLAYIYSLL